MADLELTARLGRLYTGAVHDVLRALALGMLLAALMPQARGVATLTPIPGFEIFLRMACALALATIIMLRAQSFGTCVSGVLMGFPVTASVLPVFTLALHGPEATCRLLSGFTVGLLGFVTFFFVFASLLPPAGAWPAFGAGFAACVAAVSAALRLKRLRSPA